MIQFHKLRYSNFLSTGTRPTEIDFESSKTTLVVGQNGAGKSTLLDALSFALFGKAHRNINKAQLINSINNKNMRVEVEFTAMGSTYKIARGLKPTVFQIWKDGTMINQDSHNKEYQKVLEQNIIKLNHKSFHQIVVLGSSSFVPFMQLPAMHRREVIEDLLDINVFSKMNQILRERNSLMKERIRENAFQIELIDTKYTSQHKYVEDLRKISVNQQKTKENEIEALNADIIILQEEIATHTSQQTAELDTKLAELGNKKTQLSNYKFQFTQKVKGIVKDTKFYLDNTNCPTCEQTIAEELKASKLEEGKEKSKELQTAITAADEKMADLDTEIETASTLLREWNLRNAELDSQNRQIAQWQKQIQNLKGDIAEIQSGAGNVSKAIEELRVLEDEKSKVIDTKFDLADISAYNSVITELLKDTGIKTKIIRQYLPVINKLVNQYLQILDFYVHFDLDEAFRETIRSRHRDTFSYDSFSEGEKQRIDLALLFTWRMIAKMKNSVATNLLILDETFDSSLDHEGVDNLIKILDTLGDDTNVFVISHKGEILDGKFEKKIEFIKTKNFSGVAT